MSRDIEIVVQAPLGSFTVALTATAANDPQDIDMLLDMMGKRVDRQRAIEQLPEALVDLVAAKKALDGWQERRNTYLKGRAEEKIRQRESWEAAHIAAGRRMEWQEGKREKEWLRAFDDQTKVESEKLDAEKLAHEQGIPAMEARIERLRARIRGEDKTDPLEAELNALPG